MAIAYVTDVEGIWRKLADFAEGNPLMSLAGDRLALAPDATFVFGGDAIDRGPAGRRVAATLLDAKERHPDRVVLLAGNRDINKLRLVRELAGHPPRRAPAGVVAAGRAALLRWIFAETMGARIAFQMRRDELEGAACAADAAPSAGALSDEDVAQSFLDDLAPDGAFTRYLAACKLAHRAGDTLFVHGAVTAEGVGVVPGQARAADGVDAWVEGLNAFYSRQIEAFRERWIAPDGTNGWAPIVAYQAPVPGTRLHQASVVYGRPADALGNPHLPPRRVIRWLLEQGISRVVVGHTPSGDSPSILRDEGFELVLADSSYSRLERGNKVIIDAEGLFVDARVALDEGEECAARFRVRRGAADSIVGLRDVKTGRLFKGELDGGCLAFRFLSGYAVEQVRVPEASISRADLVAPYAVED